VQGGIAIESPPETVFSWLADLARHRQFVPDGWRGYTVTTPRSTGMGARASFQPVWRRETPLEVEIIEAEPPLRLVVRSTAGDFKMTWTLARAGGGTQVGLEADLAARDGVAGGLLSAFTLAPRLRAECQQALERLKALCEGSER
jgi:uncharacterized protein YndB with AHSA1/START domain